jgi:hypothetical protein
MRRRQFMQSLVCTGSALAGFGPTVRSFANFPSIPSKMAAAGELVGPRPAFSIVPVVGDGNWIWNNPPEDRTGYLEPRHYQLKLGISIQGSGRATQIQATTPAPVNHPEQTIEDVQIETHGCNARIRELEAGAGLFGLAAP